MRITWLSTHVIQYQVPVFRELARTPGVEFKAVFLSSHGQRPSLDAAFGKVFQWDVPMTEGYSWEFAAGGNPDLVPLPPGQVPWLLPRNLLDCDVLIVSGWAHAFFWYANLFARLRAIPVLHLSDSHSRSHQRSPWFHWLKRQMFSLYFGQRGYGLPTGTLSHDYFLSLGIAKSNIIVYPHVIDTKLFEHSEDDKRQWHREVRGELSIPLGDIVFTFVGKLMSVKVPEMLLEAFAKAALPNAHLIFVGSGVLEETLRRKGHPNVHFAGFRNQTELRQWYAATDVLVLPSRNETWGLVVNEAMQMGCATIVSDGVGCHPDLVTGKETGWVFRNGDIAGLVACLRDAYENREKLERFKRNAQVVIADFTPAKTAAKLVEGCRKAIARH